MLKKIVFWGAAGHAKVLREFVDGNGYELIAAFDNNPEAIPPFTDVPLYIGREGFEQWREERREEMVAALIAIGGARGRDRHEIQRMLASRGLEPVTVVHPTAFVAADAVLGAGSQVLAHATVGVEVRMGEACILNTASSVDHECVLGDGVHIAPGATLTGCVTVGDYSLVGPGAVVLPRIRIGLGAVVGAGSVVTRDIPDGKVAFGVPAKVQRDNSIT
ncbi:acetyltransferase [soil metagenome]